MRSTAARMALRVPILAVLALVRTSSLAAHAYLGLLTVLGARRSALGPRRSAPRTRFVVMVPAHDEDSIIKATLGSLERLDYPSELFSVHVVADNCSDRTADIVREFGFQAHERFAPEQPGKGPALNWLFDRLDLDCDFDAAVIIDADTTADPQFLRYIATALEKGSDVLQGYYSVANPDDAATAGLRFAALACRHHLRPLGRNRIGASAGLYGNGMAFQRDVLRRHRWTGHLVEDAELQLELLVADGVRVTYVPEARIEAEMPASIQASTSQNARWERGRIELVRTYLPSVLRGFTRGRPAPRVAYADAAIDLLLPPISVLAAGQVTLTLTDLLASATGHRTTHRRLIVDVVTLVILVVHVAVGLRSVSAPPSAYRSLTRAPRLIVWKVGLWSRSLLPGGHVTWQRTRRNAES